MTYKSSKWYVILDNEPKHDSILKLIEEIEGLGPTGREIFVRVNKPRSTSRMKSIAICICSHVRSLHDENGKCTLCSCSDLKVEE